MNKSQKLLKLTEATLDPTIPNHVYFTIANTIKLWASKNMDPAMPDKEVRTHELANQLSDLTNSKYGVEFRVEQMAGPGIARDRILFIRKAVYYPKTDSIIIGMTPMAKPAYVLKDMRSNIVNLKASLNHESIHREQFKRAKTNVFANPEEIVNPTFTNIRHGFDINTPATSGNTFKKTMFDRKVRYPQTVNTRLSRYKNQQALYRSSPEEIMAHARTTYEYLSGGATSHNAMGFVVQILKTYVGLGTNHPAYKRFMKTLMDYVQRGGDVDMRDLRMAIDMAKTEVTKGDYTARFKSAQVSPYNSPQERRAARIERRIERSYPGGNLHPRDQAFVEMMNRLKKKGQTFGFRILNVKKHPYGVEILANFDNFPPDRVLHTIFEPEVGGMRLGGATTLSFQKKSLNNKGGGIVLVKVMT
jgi:hypothetical protein